MCGFAGVVRFDGQSIDEGLVKSLLSPIEHRGPDGEGFYIDGNVGMGHRRLAVIDLSHAGQQPMHSEDGNVVGVCNGVIYNFIELREALEVRGHQFTSRCDSEVVIHGYEEWGDSCVTRFNGVFALAIWDAERRRMLLARDRYGARPLYYSHSDGLLVFGSEIKAILAHPQVSASVSLAALNEYFTFQNILTDRTLFEGIHLLPAGCSLSWEEGTSDVHQHQYWDFRFPKRPLDCSFEEAAGRVCELFEQAVSRRLVSDAPLGFYLSGGMDSGSILAVAARRLDHLQTFTCGFDLTSASGMELAFDERQKSEVLANLYQSEHHEIVLHAGDMEAVMPELIWHLDDLRVGQSYPNYYIARLASKFVKVALCGSGGDELFGGYPWRYATFQHCRGREGFLESYYRYWQRLVPDAERRQLFNAATYEAVHEESAYDAFCGVYEGWNHSLDTSEDHMNASFYFELKTFLHGLLLVGDRVGMAHSLETRMPFLDNDLVDFSLQIPAEYKIRGLNAGARVDENDPGKRQRSELSNDSGKAVLREAMRRIIPRTTVQQMKQGFSAPDASWFRGESIDYVNDLLRDPGARIYEFLDPSFVARVLDEHRSARVNRRLLIWSFLSFEWWLRLHIHGEPKPTRIG